MIRSDLLPIPFRSTFNFAPLAVCQLGFGVPGQKKVKIESIQIYDPSIGDMSPLPGGPNNLQEADNSYSSGSDSLTYPDAGEGEFSYSVTTQVGVSTVDNSSYTLHDVNPFAIHTDFVSGILTQQLGNCCVSAAWPNGITGKQFYSSAYGNTWADIETVTASYVYLPAYKADYTGPLSLYGLNGYADYSLKEGRVYSTPGDILSGQSCKPCNEFKHKCQAGFSVDTPGILPYTVLLRVNLLIPDAPVWIDYESGSSSFSSEIASGTEQHSYAYKALDAGFLVTPATRLGPVGFRALGGAHGLGGSNPSAWQNKSRPGVHPNPLNTDPLPGDHGSDLYQLIILLTVNGQCPASDADAYKLLGHYAVFQEGDYAQTTDAGPGGVGGYISGSSPIPETATNTQVYVPGILGGFYSIL